MNLFCTTFLWFTMQSYMIYELFPWIKNQPKRKMSFFKPFFFKWQMLVSIIRLVFSLCLKVDLRSLILYTLVQTNWVTQNSYLNHIWVQLLIEIFFFYRGTSNLPVKWSLTYHMACVSVSCGLILFLEYCKAFITVGTI